MKMTEGEIPLSLYCNYFLYSLFNIITIYTPCLQFINIREERRLENPKQKVNENMIIIEDKVNSFYDEVFRELYETQLKSKDPSTKVAAVLSLRRQFDEQRIYGYNHLPFGYKDDLKILNDRAEKYPRVIHAEMHVLGVCAREGIATEGGVLFCSHCACSVCASNITTAGISKFVFPLCDYNDDFAQRCNCHIAIDTFEREGVELIGYQFSPEMMDYVRNIQCAVA